MPKISVISPVYNSEKYILDCLNSLNLQTFKDFEAIFINDGSTDNTLQIMEEYQKTHKWLKIITIENHGQGYCRNLGLTKAKGEYVLFIDSDDAISINALEKSHNLIEKDKSDFCLFTWSKFRDKDENDIKVKLNKKFLKQSLLEGDECVSLLKISPYYTVNNLYRRNFLINNDVKYAEGYIYEDVPFWVKAVTNAKKISILNEKLYIIRVNQSSTTNTNFQTDKHSKSFIKAVNESLKQINKFNDNRDYSGFYSYALDKFLYYYAVRVPRKYKEEFIDEFLNLMQNVKINHKINGKLNLIIEKYDIYKMKRKNLFKLVILLYKCKRYALALKRRLKIRLPIKKIKKYLKTCIIDSYYNKKVDDKYIFVQSKNCSDLASNMFYIIKELNKNYQDYKVFLPLNKSKIKSKKEIIDNYNLNVNIIKAYTLKYYKIIYKSKYLFTDSTFFKNYIKKDEQIIVNTWHGTALKKMGRDNIESAFELGNVQKNFLLSDYLVYPSKFMENKFLDAYMVRNLYSGEILNTGYPRNGVFYDQKREKVLRDELNLTNKKVYVYMPTWRGTMTNKENDEQIEKIIKYLEEIDSQLKENQLFFVKLHLFVNKKINFEGFKNIKPFPKKIETYDFLNIADVLITDYSSVFFDFANTGKKIILFAYDEENYLKSRGLYIEFKDLPFPKVYTVKELIKEINNKKVIDYSQFQKKYCQYDSINSTTELCNRVIGKKVKKNLPKNNHLIYISGSNVEFLVTKYLLLLDQIDYKNKNYYFLINSNVLKNNLEFVKLIDGKVSYIPLHSYIHKPLLKTKKALQKSLIKEIKRGYGNIKFDDVTYIGKKNKYKKIIDELKK